MAKVPKGHREITDEEAEAYVAELRLKMGAKLDEIQELLPKHYVLTLVARHEVIAGAEFVLTKDTNLEGVADILLQNKQSIMRSKKNDKAD